MNLTSIIADTLNIPVIPQNQKIWFFRTKAGKYYVDFQVNSFIGLGWELITSDMILDNTKSYESKREKIVKLYPDEKRPGLILSQMDTFYNKMQNGDFVIIPSVGGKQIAIGQIGDFIDNIVHASMEDEYVHCDYSHKRSVKWIRKVDSWQDIYLFKALRAQQTISDITHEGKLVLRNLFPVYVSGNNIHCTFQKDTKADLNVVDNMNLQYNLLKGCDITAELYGMKIDKDKIKMRTAVGSPGFIEIIFPNAPVCAIYICVLANFLLGKAKAPDGSTSTGILALISSINNVVNDFHNRKKTDAEVRQIDATTKLTEAQTEKTKVETELLKLKLQEFSEQIEFTESGKTTIQEREEEEKLIVPDECKIKDAICEFEDCRIKLCKAASGNEISFNGKRIG